MQNQCSNGLLTNHPFDYTIKSLFNSTGALHV